VNPGPLQILLDTLPQRGRIAWIGVRPARVFDVGRAGIGDRLRYTSE
jgi:hypothetical protein